MLCYVYVYVRIVEVEEYLDAKSDDTRDGIDWKKRYSRRFPLKTKLLSGTQKATMAKKKKKRSGGSKSPKKLFSPLCWKRILSRVIRFFFFLSLFLSIPNRRRPRRNSCGTKIRAIARSP